MGLDSRYDCFDCQKNKFEVKSKDTVGMEALFRIPRQSFPGYLQSKIVEDLHVTAPVNEEVAAQLQSQGRMFGLTFWENWYILADEDSVRSSPQIDFSIQKVLTTTTSPRSQAVDKKDGMKLVFYTGHTLQGSYKGAFVYSRSSQMTPQLFESASKLIRKAGLKPTDFCVIRNQCFLSGNGGDSSGGGGGGGESEGGNSNSLAWIFGDKFFRATKSVAAELADWFEDPTLLSEWLINQQQRSILQQPLVSMFFSCSCCCCCYIYTCT